MQKQIIHCFSMIAMLVLMLTGAALAAEQQEPIVQQVEAAGEQQAEAVQRQEIAIVMTGDNIFFTPEYQMVIKNSLLGCVNQYRNHMEYGPEIQQAYLAANGQAKGGFVPGLASKMGKTQVLLLEIKNRTWWHYENLGGLWFDSELVWGANIEVLATLFNDQEILEQVKVYRQTDEKNSEGEALQEVYKYAVSKLRYEIYGK